MPGTVACRCLGAIPAGALAGLDATGPGRGRHASGASLATGAHFGHNPTR